MAGIRDIGPRWLHTDHNQRYPVAVDGVTGASSGTVEVTINVPSFWDDFWDNVQDTTNGYDIVVTDSDGVSVLTFDLAGTFNHANKTCTIRISGLVLDAASKMTCIWLYWNKASASSQQGTPTTASPITAYVYLGKPTGETLVVARHETPGVTTPSQRIFKDPAEVFHVWWDVTDILARQVQPYNRGTGLESIAWATHSELAPGAFTPSDANTRYAMADGKLYVRVQGSAGGTGTNANSLLTIKTTEGRTLVFYVGLYVLTLSVAT